MGGAAGLIMRFGGGDISSGARNAGSVILALVVLAAVVWCITALKKDKVPDFLRKISPRHFHRDGLSFAIVPSQTGDHQLLDCLFQNRYSKQCEAQIVFTPKDRLKYPQLSAVFSIQCPGAGLGRRRLHWKIPEYLQGKRLTFNVASVVRYPEGRGELLRYHTGQHVGKAEGNNWGLTALGVFAGAVVITRPANLILLLPFCSSQTDLDGETSLEIFWKIGDALETGIIEKLSESV